MPYKNLEKRKEYGRMYREKNRDKINARVKKWSKGEKQQEKIKKYKEKNREKLLQYWVEYRKKPGYKKKFNQYYKKWITEKLKNDPHFKMKQLLSHRIYLALKVKGVSKSIRTMKLLGCTVEELWKHLESKFQPGMTRENHGKWHVDHIKPCASFDLTDAKQQAECFHYTNLQPLWSEQNLKKGSKLLDASGESLETGNEQQGASGGGKLL